MTFEELEETVIPRLGIGYRSLSFTELITAYNGIIKEKVNDYEFLMKTVHNAARMQAFFVVKSMPFLRSIPKKFEDLIRFPWEGKAKNRLQKPTEKEWEKYKNLKCFPDKLPGYDT